MRPCIAVFILYCFYQIIKRNFHFCQCSPKFSFSAVFSCVIMICSGRFCATGCGGSKPPPYDNFVFTIFVGLDAHIEPYNPSVSCADRRFCNRLASLVKDDSPRCGEMSRSDRGDGHRLGGGFAVGKLGGIDALATKQPPGLFLPNADAFGPSCLLHCVQFTREQAPALRQSYHFRNIYPVRCGHRPLHLAFY